MNRSSILVSVVMSAFNEELYIGQAIDSILNQSHSNLELIIINDGSTDRTADIVMSYNDSRIIFVNNSDNLNQAVRANQGLSLAEGKYIARLDADDISLPNRLEKQVEYLESHSEIDIVGSQIRIIEESDNAIYDYKKLPLLPTEIEFYRFFFALLFIQP